MASADGPPPVAGEETLGFQAAKIKSPDAAKGEPVARLFYDYIYPADLQAKSRVLSDDEARRLTARVFGALRQRYVSQHKITATPEEIQHFADSMNRFREKTEENLEPETEADRNAWRSLGEQSVKGWKFDRALYEKYGGTVIFQQANPFEPVGAYRKFLEAAEQAKLFEIYDEANRRKFYHYFTRKHPGEIPADDVDFDKPWWLMKPKTEHRE